MEQLQHMCNNLKDNNEIVIVKKYANIAKFYTIMLTSKILFFYFCNFVAKIN